MIIKKFLGKTEEEATEAARRELGPNIVIMNVRPVKRTGFLSFMKPQKTEVTVALEDEREFFVPYILAPVMRQPIAQERPVMVEKLNALAKAVDDRAMRRRSRSPRAVPRSPAIAIRPASRPDRTAG